MKILLANDDGVHAPGLKILWERLRKEHDCFVVAPSRERSTTGHTLNLLRPLRVEKVDQNVYSCDGYPADCVLLGLHLMGERPDVIISGINRGANLCQDIYYSGTVAAAREGSFHDVPGIATSLVFDEGATDPNYLPCADFVAKFLEAGLTKLIPPWTVLNINAPSKSGPLRAKMAEVGKKHYSEEISHRTDPRGRDYYWIEGRYLGQRPSDGNTDDVIVEQGQISATLLGVAETVESEELKQKLESL